MKILRYLKHILIVPVMALATGCDDYLDVNESPNNPTDVPLTLIFPGALVGTAYHVGGDLNIAGSFFTQQWANGSLQYIQIDRYDQEQCDGQNSWTEMYVTALHSYQQIIDKAAELDATGDNYAATAKIMLAHGFAVMTDLYGDIPYTDALVGIGLLQPTVDGQEDIYPKLQDLLDEAIQQIDLADNEDLLWTNEDLIYQGDMDKWKRLANSIKFRLYMRLSEKDPTTAEQGVAQLINDNALMISSVDEEAQVFFGTAADDRNPIAQSYSNTSTLHPSKLIVDLMLANNDPRLDTFAVANFADQFVGTPNGVNATTEESILGSPFTDNSAPVVLFSFEEVLFLRAEAAARGWTTEDDEALYNEAVTFSLTKWGAGATAVSDYLSQVGIDYPTGGTLDDKWERIYTEKWIALFGQGVEMFNDARRAGFRFPAGIAPAEDNILTGSDYPARLAYPIAELSTNENLNLVPLGQKVWFADF